MRPGGANMAEHERSWPPWLDGGHACQCYTAPCGSTRIMGESSIEWTDVTWNPIRGCERISPGCGGGTPGIQGTGGCYAERLAYRFSAPGKPFEGLVKLGKTGPRWTGVMRLIEDKLSEPARMRRPRHIFVNSMSDLFHKELVDDEIAAVFGGMAAAPQHTFQILTKRADRMVSWFQWVSEAARARGSSEQALCLERYARAANVASPMANAGWPLPHVHLGVSVESQQYADERIPLLLGVPATRRTISAEPLLGPLELSRYLGPNGLDQVIVGGESGPGARPFDIRWAHGIVEQCERHGVPCFVKQLGAKPIDSRAAGARLKLVNKKGGDMKEWPVELRVRMFPGDRWSA